LYQTIDFTGSEGKAQKTLMSKGRLMKIDRKKIVEIISTMLDNPGKCGIYPTGEAYDALERYIEEVRILALGWMHADCCTLLDKGLDPRTMIIPDTLQRALRDLEDTKGHADALKKTMDGTTQG
jgi:hypothetical protein